MRHPTQVPGNCPRCGHSASAQDELVERLTKDRDRWQGIAGARLVELQDRLDDIARLTEERDALATIKTLTDIRAVLAKVKREGGNLHKTQNAHGGLDA